MFRRLLLFAVSPGILALLGCAESRDRPATAATPEASPVFQASDEALDGVNNPAFHAKLLEIATAYRKFGRVDSALLAQWSTTLGLCRAPIEDLDYTAGQIRFSFSKDPSTHGDKLYYLYAQNRQTYLDAPAGVSPLGQFVVKESWVPEEGKLGPSGGAVKAGLEWSLVPGSKTRRDPMTQSGEYLLSGRVAMKDGKIYYASRMSGLFILAKLDPKTPGTDNGWIYGTVTADGKTVTSAGRVGYCMRCHASKPDRLYGMAPEIAKQVKKGGPN